MLRSAGVALLGISFLCLSSASQAQPSNPIQDSSSSDPLLQLLIKKGLISSGEADAVTTGGTAAEQRNRLAALLRNKGLLTDEEYRSVTPAAKAEPVLLASASPTAIALPPAATVQPAKPQVTAAPAPPPVIAAIAPIRSLPIDPAKREGMIPDIKLGTGVRMKPYGFVKTSAIYDTSSPGGNDMPLVGFLGDTGPDASPEFHVKARSFRIGAQFEGLDPSPKWALTARVEADFEGNFSRANNRNISSIRSSMFSLRTAYARMDHNLENKDSFFFLFGQDWTPFGSSTLPNVVETTGLGLGYGTLYERLPQIRIGYVKNLGGPRTFKLSPEFAITMPSFAALPANISDQLGYGERQGADSARPEVQARLVGQWQLDRAPGVAPAQLIVSALQGERRVIVPAANIPAAFKSAFPTGADTSSDRYGVSAEAQLPTRYFTLLAKWFTGRDLRFYFTGELLGAFTDSAGLTGTATAASIDGASNVIFGLRNGTPVVAPQYGVRTTGGFVNLGLPLSRIFNANPAGRNAGWTTYFHYSLDEAFARDARRFAGGRGKSDWADWNLQYKMNSFTTFMLAESYYRTRAANTAASNVGGLPLLRGIPSRAWHDLRTELAMMFSF